MLPSGSWGTYTSRTNAPFTITGLSAGDYEFEFVLVNADETVCPAVYRTYTVISDYDCISFASEMKQVNGLYHIEITYTLPGGYTDPPCGWEFEYTPSAASPLKFTMSALPVSGIIKIPCQNVSTSLYIRALMCNGRTKNCHANDVTNFPDPPCVPFSSVSMNIIEQQGANGKCEYYLDVSFTQSSPATTTVNLQYVQWTNGLPAGDNFNGSVSISATATTFRRKLNPHFLEGQECSGYYVNFIDVCGNGPSTYVPFCRTMCFDKTP